MEKARGETVRGLAAEVRVALGDVAAEAVEEEPWERVGLVLEPGARQQLGVALDLAGRLLGATSPPWQRLEVICQEYLGSHQAPPEPARPFAIEGLNRPVSPDAETEALKAWLEQEYQHWSFLSRFDPAPLARHAVRLPGPRLHGRAPSTRGSAEIRKATSGAPCGTRQLHRLRWRFRPGGGPLLRAAAQALAS